MRVFLVLTVILCFLGSGCWDLPMVGVKLCDPEDEQCDGEVVWECNTDDGEWDSMDCSSIGQVCVDTDGEPMCVEDTDTTTELVN